MYDLNCRNMISRTDTDKYTTCEIWKEIQNCLQIIEEVLHIDTKDYHYETKISSRMTNTLGYCHRNFDKNYTIVISAAFLSHANAQTVHDTIMHEVLHSMPNGMNHGPVWKAYAAKICTNYPQYTITRTTCDYKYKNFLDSSPTINKYTLVCNKCNHEWHYQRLSKTLRTCNDGHHICPYCGNKSFKLI